jgi:hypothetical protein
MSGAERCDEIMRLIDDVLAECEHRVSPRQAKQPVRIRASH